MADNNLQLSVDLALDTGNFRKGIGAIDKQLKASQKQFDIASKGVEGFTKSTEGCNKAIEFFSKQQDGLNKKLSLQVKEFGDLSQATEQMKKKLEGLDRSTKEGEKAFQRLSSGIQDNIGKLSRMETAISSTKREIDKMDDSINDAKQSLQELSKGDSSFKSLKEIFSDASTGAVGFGDSISELVGAIPEVGSAAGGIVGTVTGAFGTMAGASGVGLLIGAVAGVTTVISKIGTEAYKVSKEWEGAMRRIENATGSSTKELKKLDKELKELDSSAWSSSKSTNDLAEALILIEQQLSGQVPTDKYDQVAEQALALADTFGWDLSETIRTADILMTNYGLTAEESFNYMVYGAQRGLDSNNELLDTLAEYAPLMAANEVPMESFFNTLITGNEAGAFSIDKLADAQKEFNILAAEGGDEYEEVIGKMSEGTQKLWKDYQDGKITVEEFRIGATNDLMQIENQAERNRAGTILYGTLFEDLGDKSIGATTKMDKGLKNVDGTTKKLTSNVSENAKKWEELKARGSESMRKLGEKLSPIVTKFLDLGLAIMDCVDGIGKIWKKIKDNSFVKAFGTIVKGANSLIGLSLKPEIGEIPEINAPSVTAKINTVASEVPTPKVNDILIGTKTSVPKVKTPKLKAMSFDFKMPKIKDIKVKLDVDTSAITKATNMLQRMANFDYNSSIYRANNTASTQPVVINNNDNTAILQAMQQQNNILMQLLNKEQSLNAQLYIDGKQMKSHFNVMDRRQNRLAGVY